LSSRLGKLYRSSLEKRGKDIYLSREGGKRESRRGQVFEGTRGLWKKLKGSPPEDGKKALSFGFGDESRFVCADERAFREPSAFLIEGPRSGETETAEQNGGRGGLRGIKREGKFTSIEKKKVGTMSAFDGERKQPQCRDDRRGKMANGFMLKHRGGISDGEDREDFGRFEKKKALLY